jgi:DNA-binding MarR family transcriptional regulator
MLLPQYGLSRLIDRMVDAELAVRMQCAVDKRGNFVGITDAGRDVQKKMGSAYSAAIERHVGSKLTDVEAQKLAQLLERLKTPASVH